MKWIALALTVLTGFTGLVYEVTWQKCLSTLLGSHSEATAAVLAIFLGGLSVGYALFGRLTQARVARAEASGDSTHLLRFYGFVEAAIGLHALCFPWLFRGAQAVSLWLPQSENALTFGFDVVLSALLIGPATVLMGGTIPILTQALARSLDDATRVHAHIYAFNTTGAFAGALAAGFVLIPWLGIAGVLAAMGVVNLSAGAAFLAIGSRYQETPLPEPGGAADAGEVAGFGLYAWVALLLGFAMMATQTVLIRMGGLALGASHFTFSMVVAVFVLCIALGSLAVSALPRIPRIALPAVVWSLAACFALLFLVADDAPYWAHWLRIRFDTVDADFYPYHLTAFALLLGVIGLPVGLSGATLPLLFDHLRHQVDDLGSIAGRLYSWNTVGNLLGALLGGYVLLLWIDLDPVYRVALGATVAAAALLTVRVAGVRRSVALVVALASVAGIALLPSWDPHQLAAGLFRTRTRQPHSDKGPAALFAALPRTVEFYTDDPVASVAVKLSFEEGESHRAIVSNGKSDGSTGGDYPTMALAGLLPCLMADQCQRAFVIGYGTGVSAGELAELDSMEQVVVAEISRGVIEAAPRFDFGNRQASRSPKVEIVRSDAYRALLRSRGEYDVIVSEPSNPWVTGVEMLYSREFLEAAKSRLRPGGIYSQWFHAYETDRATLEMVIRTYLEVFEGTALWFTRGPDMLLLGFQDPDAARQFEHLSRRFDRPDYRQGLRRAGVHSLPELLIHELAPLGVLRRLDLSGPLHTLMHPRLSHIAARAFFRGGLARTPSSAPLGQEGEPPMLSRYLQRAPDALDDDAIRRGMVEQLCGNGRSDECGSALAWWRWQAPDSRALARVRARMLPARADAAAGARGVLDDLYRFYAGQPDDPLSVDEVSRLGRLYRRHHLAPLPFPPDTWDTLWKRCRGERGECAAARQAVAEEALGVGE
ncbi:MAG: fused MFS/spermidine synthase [Myxococcota bacterium]